MAMIDSHIHLFEHGFGGTAPAADHDLAGYRELRRRHDIDTAVVVGYQGEPWCRTNNDYLRRVREPWMRLLAYVDVADPAPAPAAVDPAFDGIAIYPPDGADPRHVAARLAGLLEVVDAERLIVSINTGPGNADLVTALARACPRATVLWSHLGLPAGRESGSRSRRAVVATAESPNVMVKLSGLYALGVTGSSHPHEELRPYLGALLRSFGPERIAWGSDFAPCLEHQTFAQAVDVRHLLDLPDRDWALVAGGNLARVLRSVRNPVEEGHS
ncbi:amidohydrolase family protein [Jiangella muralis]|uniref:amidohydrolase family protein n=1 Tax=Jiangella muralis TaxID=702383 RepID=UPI00069E00AA|nr:amidohydrolase family protein [Jiangella muralis]